MLQNQICLNRNHRPTLTKNHNSQTFLCTLRLENYSLGLCNFVYLSTFLFNVFQRFLFFILGSTFFYIYGWAHIVTIVGYQLLSFTMIYVSSEVCHSVNMKQKIYVCKHISGIWGGGRL